MIFLLNLGFLHGQQMNPARIMASEPAIGELTKITPVYMEMTGFEHEREAFYAQSWILRAAPPSYVSGFNPKDDDSTY